MIASISRALGLLAGVGWALSVGASVALLAGAPMPQWPWLWWSVIAGAWLTGFLGQILLFAVREEILHWWTLHERAMDRSPSWARIATWVSGLYSLCLIVGGFGFDNPTYIFAGQLALVGMLYAYALRLLMTTAAGLKCNNGHPVGPFTKYCHQCGVAVPEAM